MMNISMAIKGIVGAVLIVGASVAVRADVKITYSPKLQKHLSEINEHEIRSETEIREDRADWKALALKRGVDPEKIERNRKPRTNDRLIPDIEDYSVTNLLKVMFERGVKEADPDFKGDVLVHVERLGVHTHAVSVLRAGDTYMNRYCGNWWHLMALLLWKKKVSANPVRRFVSDRQYDGPNYVYWQGSLNQTVGPIFAYFSKKALDRLFPDYDAPGLVVWQTPLLRVRPNEA